MLGDEINILLTVNASDAVIIGFWGFMAGQMGKIAQNDTANAVRPLRMPLWHGMQCGIIFTNKGKTSRLFPLCV